MYRDLQFFIIVRLYCLHIGIEKRNDEEACDIYKLLLIALKYFRIITFREEVGKLMPSGYPECWACHGSSERHIAIDGCYALSRLKNNPGYSSAALNFFFLEKQDVFPLVLEEDQNKKRKKTILIPCSEFKVEKNEGNSMADRDETGVVGLFCARHETPLIFTDMWTAERYDSF